MGDEPYGLIRQAKSIVFYFIDGTEVWEADPVPAGDRTSEVYAEMRRVGRRSGGTRP